MPEGYRKRDWSLMSDEDLSRAVVLYTGVATREENTREQMSGVSPNIRRPQRGKNVHVDDDLSGSDNDIPPKDISGDESLSHSQDDLEPSDSASASLDINARPARRKSRRHSREDTGDRQRSEAKPRNPTVATSNPQRLSSRRTTQRDITDGKSSGTAKTKKPPMPRARGAEKLRSRFDLQPSPEPYSDADSYDFGWEHYPPPPPRASASYYGHRHRSHAPRTFQSQMVPYDANPLNPFAPPQEGIPYQNPAPSGYSMHGYFSQPPASYLYPPPPPPPPTEHPTPAPPQEAPKTKVELEMERLRADMEAELRAKKEADKRRELEESIRREAEETMQRRMEAARRAQDDVRRELERAKQEAEAAARKRLEEERKAEEQRQIALAEERARASAEERARVQAALKAEELQRERRKEEEMRMLKEAKEKALLELEAERERARRDEVERANLLEELRAQVRQEMAAEAARLARNNARSSTGSRSRHRPRGGSRYPGSTEVHVTSRPRARGAPPGAPNPPPPRFLASRSAQTGSGEEDEVVVEERGHATDDSDSSSTHWSDSSSSSLKSWRSRNARRRRQEEKEERRQIRMLGKELAPPIIEALIGHLPVAGRPYMPAPMPTFYMQHPPMLPSVNDPRRKQRAAVNDYLYSRSSSDEADDSESDADTITPRRSQRHARPERQIGSRNQSRDTSMANDHSRSGRRGIRTSNTHSESNSQLKQDAGGSKVSKPKRPSHGTDGVTTAQELHKSGRNPILDSNSQSTSTEVELSKEGENPGEPLASAETNRELLVDIDIPDAELSNLDSQTGEETEKEGPTARRARHLSQEAREQLPPPSSPEDIGTGLDLSDTESVAFKPPAASQASTSSQSGRQISVKDTTATTDSDKEDVKTRNTPRGAVESMARSPRQQRRLERLEKKRSTVGERSHRNKKQSHTQDQDHRDRDEPNMSSPFGPGTALGFNHAEQEMLPVPLPGYYPNPYQLGMPSGFLGSNSGTYGWRTKSRTSRGGGSSRRGDRTQITVPTMQPYGLLVMPSVFTPMPLGPPSFY